MRVMNTTLSNTNGTSPAHGVDFEPDTPNQRLSDIVFSNCTSVGNQGSGFGFDFAGLTSTHWAAGLPPVTISFEDCDAIGNHAGWTLTTAYPGLPGSVEVVRGTTSGSLSHGIGIYNKAASALGVSFRDHQVWNVSTGGSACTDVDAAKLCPDGKPVNAPVALFIRDGTPEKEGGVNLSNLSVADSHDRPWLQVIGDSNGWSDVSLDWVSVTNPHGCVADLSHVYGTHPVPAHQTPVSGLADVHCIKADDDEAGVTTPAAAVTAHPSSVYDWRRDHCPAVNGMRGVFETQGRCPNDVQLGCDPDVVSRAQLSSSVLPTNSFQAVRGQADAPVKAFRNTSGEVIVLASVDLGSRAFVGSTLGTATHRCGVYFNSTLDYAMSASACREWIQSPYSFPNGSTYALTHMECKRAAPFRFLALSS